MPIHSSKQATRKGRNAHTYQQTPEELEAQRLRQEAQRREEAAREEARRQREAAREEARRQREAERLAAEARRQREAEARRRFEEFLRAEFEIAPVAPLPPGGIAFQVHAAFNNINKAALLAFFNTNVGTIVYPQTNNTAFANYTISKLANYGTLVGNFNTTDFQLVRTRLLGMEFTNQEKEIIAKSLVFTDSQPDEFKGAYVTNFVQDCAHAYNSGSNQMSCGQGIKERFVFSLIPAAVSRMGNPEYTANHYAELISIIQPTSLKTLVQNASANCIRDKNSISENEFRTCIHSEIQGILGEGYNEATVNAEINLIIPSVSNIFSGGKRRRMTRRHKRKGSKKTHRRR